MHIWALQDAKARLSELVKLCLSEGPQQITLRGQEAVTVVATAEWKRLTDGTKLGIKEWLLTDFARTDNLVPPRRRVIMRKTPMSFED